MFDCSDCSKNCLKQFFESCLGLFLGQKKPIIKENTFIVWEPCSKSHAEVVPGYVKYLLDLGYHVSICVNPQRYKEGLFARFKDDNISLNKLSKYQIRNFFKNNDLAQVKGVLVTTAAKLYDEVHFDECYKAFNEKADRSKIFFVVHEARQAIDEGTWNEKLVTLRELDYKGAKSTVINPHYFGSVTKKEKNNKVRFVMVGALRAKRNDANMIVNAVKKLHENGITNFVITVVGKGRIKDLPKELHPYFEIKGRLPFDKMYDVIENSDFILTSYDDRNEKHRRYITTGTSGTFQLVYGFNRPCVIIDKFAGINGFNEKNAVLYSSPDTYYKALEEGINMSQEEYTNMCKNLKQYSDSLYENSLNNLKTLASN